jgi:hypothetical protein
MSLCDDAAELTSSMDFYYFFSIIISFLTLQTAAAADDDNLNTAHDNSMAVSVFVYGVR